MRLIRLAFSASRSAAAFSASFAAASARSSSVGANAALCAAACFFHSCFSVARSTLRAFASCVTIFDAGMSSTPSSMAGCDQAFRLGASRIWLETWTSASLSSPRKRQSLVRSAAACAWLDSAATVVSYCCAKSVAACGGEIKFERVYAKPLRNRFEVQAKRLVAERK